MNLIEQLGGYEKLRPHFILTDGALGYTHVYLHGSNHYYFLDDRVDYIIPERAFTTKEVIDALLEYRRQHNIFEVGDVACYKNYINSNNTLFKFFHDGEYSDIIALLRHATDEEVKEGRRL